ncbi:morphogenic membrane protein MmpB [Streptacidiphilus sp. MAP12-33]
MLWSDPADDTPAEVARIRELLRRVGILIALCVSLAMVVVMASW